MFVYYWFMRKKDLNKEECILQSSLTLITTQGLSNLSMSKIAKASNVSPATIYIYFKNKEDLINKLYLKTKEKMSESIFTTVHSQQNLKEQYRQIVTNFIHFNMENENEFLFLEQIQNSPVLDSETLKESDEMFSTLFNLYTVGKQKKILKNSDSRLLSIMTSSPTMEYVKLFHKKKVEGSPEEIKDLINMCWDAIAKK